MLAFIVLDKTCIVTTIAFDVSGVTIFYQYESCDATSIYNVRTGLCITSMLSSLTVKLYKCFFFFIFVHGYIRDA